MLRLRTFGGAFLERDGESLGGAARQRRVVALLALLGAAREQGMSRDRVLGILWTEGDPDKSRQALTQALYHIRRVLGEEELFFAAADLRLNPAVITTDVGEFEDALDRGDLERAVSLYQGAFLDGFYVTGAAEFERWAAAERSRLTDRCAHALDELAIRADAASDYRRAVEWRKQLAALDPLNSRVALELMQAMARAGDRAGAIQHARVHETLLRQELDVAADAVITELAERLRDAMTSSPSSQSPDGASSRGLVSVEPESPPARLPDAARSEAGPAERGVDRGPDQTAQDYVDHDRSAVDAHTVPTGPSLPPAPSARRMSVRRISVRHVGVLAVILAIGIAGILLAARDRRAPVIARRDAIVVAPFRVAGADPSLAYLREGLLDLLATKLTDDAVAAADPAAVMMAWRRAGYRDGADLPRTDALRTARQLGGERLVLGSVIGTSERVVLSALVLGVGQGELRAQATVEGPAANLTELVDRLTARLLAAEAGSGERLAQHTTTSLHALRAFLDGQAAYRRGHYRDAVQSFRRALERDTAFAMAGLGLAQAADRLNAAEERSRGLAVAWAHRGELVERDRVYLEALAGPRYPAPSSEREQLAAWERAVVALPNRAEVWRELGERFYYSGQLLGIRNWDERARGAFRRASALDTAFASPLQYLVQLAAKAGDSAEVRRAAVAYFRLDSAGDLAAFVRWRQAVALGDEARLRALRRQFPAMPAASLRTIAVSAQSNGVEFEDAERALDALLARSVRSADRVNALLDLHALAVNRGRPTAAFRITVDLTDLERWSTLPLRLRVLDALYGEGDSTRAASSVRELTRTASALPDRCVAEQWRLWHGDTSTAHQAIGALASAQDGTSAPAACAALLDAIAAIGGRRVDAPAAVARLDSLLSLGPAIGEMQTYGHVALARLYELLEEPRNALAAIRRRPHMQSWPAYLATALREEGRLAASLADTADAQRAYSHFLALRSDPERDVAPTVAAVREELRQLTAPRR